MNIHGYSEEVAQAMEHLQNDMKKYCDGDMGNDQDAIKLKPKDNDIIPVRSYKLPHHDLMIPHWKRLTKALHYVSNVEIWNICLPRPVLETILPSFRLKRLALLEVNLMNDEFEYVSSFLEKNSSLECLFLGGNIIEGNIIDGISTASSFSDSVSNHPKLKKLLLSECGLGNSVILEIILEGCKGLICLSMPSNRIGSEGSSVISDFISGNHPLQYLDLDENKISNSDVAILASALKVNTHLRNLSLEGNEITTEGERFLMNALFDATSMNSIVESNHNCIPHTYDLPDGAVMKEKFSLMELFILDANSDKNVTIKQKIRKKVILALCGVGGDLFDLSHLNELPLELMPRVLELIQEHTEHKNRICNVVELEKEALSRLFHTLRGWELPLLFENLRHPATAGARKRKRRSTRR